MNVTKQTKLLVLLLTSSAMYVPIFCDHNKEQKPSWTQRIVNTVYEHRLKCAVVPLIAVGVWMQYHYGPQNLVSLRVVVPNQMHSALSNTNLKILTRCWCVDLWDDSGETIRAISQTQYDESKLH